MRSYVKASCPVTAVAGILDVLVANALVHLRTVAALVVTSNY
jgi:hypothetical protein